MSLEYLVLEGLSRSRAVVTRSLCLIVVVPLFVNAGPKLIAEDRHYQLLRASIEVRLSEDETLVNNGFFRLFEPIARLYATRNYAPLWFSEHGLSRQARELIGVLSDASAHGISPDRYRLSRIQTLAFSESSVVRSGARAELELLLTDALLLHAADLTAGRVDPVQLLPLWDISTRLLDPLAVVDSAAHGSPRAVVAKLAPRAPEYAMLQHELMRLRSLSFVDWSPLQRGDRLEVGSDGVRVARLQQTLVGLGYLDSDITGRYDERTRSAVIRFQQENGLKVDGIVGRVTTEVLNDAHPDSRIRRIETNLERWRWLPEEMGERYVLVNIAGFDLRLINRGEVELTMKVIVGTDARRSPVMSELMTYLVLNPAWNVPHTIAVRDKLPQFKRNPSLVESEGFELYDGWDANARPLNAAEIDWQRLGTDRFPYRLRQRPGPNNALGRIKFMFPNKYNVYLHDTPRKDLFAKSERAFSSGCIRIEKPLLLAVALLKDDPTWTLDSLERMVATGKERVVPLPRPVPVHLAYWTAWVELDGQLQYRRDLYGRDRLLDEAMRLADAA